jgi:hypothetical protein
MMIPTCIDLNEDQKAALNKFVDFLKRTSQLPETGEEDCCCTYPIEFRVSGSGIGDIVWAYGGTGIACNLSIDDDGNVEGGIYTLPLPGLKLDDRQKI